MNPLRPAALFLAVLHAAAILVPAHEGHSHGEAPPERTAQAGPVTLSEEAKKNLDIRTAEASIRAIEKTLKATGIVEAIPGSRETVSSAIAGRVAELPAALGQAKRKGGIVAVLEARQLAETPIRVPVKAPRSGEVAKLNVIKGDAVEAGSPLLEIADYGEVYAVARVFESQIGRVAKGMPARVYSPVLKNKQLDSRVEIIGSEVNPQSRTVEVRLRVKNPGGLLKLNMTVNVFFLADQEEESIVVPRSAVLGTAGERFVFLAEGNEYTRTAVVTGIENDKWIEIVEGVAPGDVVVTQGNYQLQFAKPKPPAEAKTPAQAK